MSRKQSASRIERERQLSLVEFFIDRSIGSGVIASELSARGAKVHIHSRYFKDDELDENWLRFVGERGWVVIHSDAAILKNELEREALIAAGVRAFVFAKRDMKAPEQAKLIAAYLPTMRGWAVTKPAPFVAADRGRHPPHVSDEDPVEGAPASRLAAGPRQRPLLHADTLVCRRHRQHAIRVADSELTPPGAAPGGALGIKGGQVGSVLRGEDCSSSPRWRILPRIPGAHNRGSHHELRLLPPRRRR